MKEKASPIGLVLGLVFLIMGFAYSNTGVWILGFIFLAIGGYDLAKKGERNKASILPNKASSGLERGSVFLYII